MTAVAVAPNSSADLPLSERTVRDALDIPMVAAEPFDHFIQSERIRRGDSLASLLSRLGALDIDFQRFVADNPTARGILQMQPGRTVLAELDAQGRIHRFSYRVSGLEEGSARPMQTGRRVLVERRDDRFVVAEEDVPLERDLASRSVEIRTTLNAATAAGGLPDAIAAQLNDVFSASLDVSKDLQQGDTVRVVYETLREAGSFDTPVAGRLLAAELVAGGVRHEAIWFEPTVKPIKPVPTRGTASRGDYYDFSGRPLRNSFLRNPLETSRVMSGFTEARRHPIMRDWRAHKGVDFAAPTGTRVRSTGDGVVEFVGRQRGYGNVIIVRHVAKITTLYAHLNGFASAIKEGTRVTQGDVIGFVGSTGWATGPHLHYEFRIDDEQTDPLTVVLPASQPPLEPADRARFEQISSSLQAELQQFGDLQVARFQ
ncbi:MAG: M23 family metallopeptidase [Burkholderiaceae bacterium]